MIYGTQVFAGACGGSRDTLLAADLTFWCTRLCDDCRTRGLLGGQLLLLLLLNCLQCCWLVRSTDGRDWGLLSLRLGCTYTLEQMLCLCFPACSIWTAVARVQSIQPTVGPILFAPGPLKQSLVCRNAFDTLNGRASLCILLIVGLAPCGEVGQLARRPPRCLAHFSTAS